MASEKIQELFDLDIHRDIREVIKVDQTDEAVIQSEIQEYIVTHSIRDSFVEILERYREAPLKPSDRMAVWISGFFGSGKSSFAKMLGLALANRQIGPDTAASLLAQRIGDPKATVLLKTIVEKIPTNAVIFDVATDRGVMHGNQMLTEIMYRQLLKHLGYASDLDLAELEITLEGEGRLEEFTKTYHRLYPNKEWDREEPHRLGHGRGQPGHARAGWSDLPGRRLLDQRRQGADRHQPQSPGRALQGTLSPAGAKTAAWPS